MLKMKKYTIEELKEMVREVNSCDGDGSLENYKYYEMGQLDELLCQTEPAEVLRMAHFGDFNWNDEYFQINDYGNLESYRALDVAIQIEANQDEIIEHYKELVESGDIEELF